MEEAEILQEDIGMELIRQAAILNGVAVCAQAVANSMENGDLSREKGAAAVSLFGKNVMQVSSVIMAIQEKMQQ